MKVYYEAVIHGSQNLFGSKIYLLISFSMNIFRYPNIHAQI